MKIFSINIRGWGGAEKRKRLKKMIVSGKFDLYMIQENKNRNLTKRTIASNWGGGDFDYVSKDATS